MMVLKNQNNIFRDRRSGFSLIEVVIAIAIFASMITTLFVLQGRLLERTSDVYTAWKGIVDLENCMVEVERKSLVSSGAMPYKKKSSDGRISLTCSLQKIRENSSIHTMKNFKFLVAEATWSGIAGRLRSEKLLSGVRVLQVQEQQS